MELFFIFLFTKRMVLFKLFNTILSWGLLKCLVFLFRPILDLVESDKKKSFDSYVVLLIDWLCL
jgi:hypothetical protein